MRQQDEISDLLNQYETKVKGKNKYKQRDYGTIKFFTLKNLIILIVFFFVALIFFTVLMNSKNPKILEHMKETYGQDFEITYSSEDGGKKIQYYIFKSKQTGVEAHCIQYTFEYHEDYKSRYFKYLIGKYPNQTYLLNDAEVTDNGSYFDHFIGNDMFDLRTYSIKYNVNSKENIEEIVNKIWDFMIWLKEQEPKINFSIDVTSGKKSISINSINNSFKSKDEFQKQLINKLF